MVIGRFQYFLMFILGLFSVLGLQEYNGQTYVYILFSLSIFTLIKFCFLQKKYLGFVYLSTFLFMGFYYKLNFFLFTQKPFIEPIGSFNFSPESWDNVLMCASVGMWGLITSLTLANIFAKNKHQQILNTTKFNSVDATVTSFFKANSHRIYLASILIVFVVTTMNSILGIHRIGLSPTTVLVWPMNALIAFSINIGFMIYLSVLFKFSSQQDEKNYWGIGAVFFVSLLTSTSAISRGMFVFQTIPFLVAILVYTKTSLKNFATHCFAFAVFLLFSLSITKYIRSYAYFNITQKTTQNQKLLMRLEVIDGGILHVKKLIENGDQQQQHLQELELEKAKIQSEVDSSVLTPEPPKEIEQPLVSNRTTSLKEDIKLQVQEVQKVESENIFTYIVNLSNSRFIGLEGIMAVQSYQSKSFELFKQAMTEKRSLQKSTMYQDVSKSNYKYFDQSIWQFASLPGPVAFFYYSGSYAAIFIGMFIFGILLCLIENSVMYFSKNNIYLNSLIMCNIANAVAQFGITPRQDIPYLTMLIISSFLITSLVHRIFIFVEKAIDKIPTTQQK